MGQTVKRTKIRPKNKKPKFIIKRTSIHQVSVNKKTRERGERHIRFTQIAPIRPDN